MKPIILILITIALLCDAKFSPNLSCQNRILFNSGYAHEWRKDYNQGFITQCLPREPAKIVEEKEYTSGEKSTACFNHTSWCEFPMVPIKLDEYKITCYQTDKVAAIHRFKCRFFEMRTWVYQYNPNMSCAVIDVICDLKIDVLRSSGFSLLKFLGINISAIKEVIETTMIPTVSNYVVTVTDYEENHTTTFNNAAEKNSYSYTSNKEAHRNMERFLLIFFVVILGVTYWIAMIRFISTNGCEGQETSSDPVHFNRENQNVNLNFPNENEI